MRIPHELGDEFPDQASLIGRLTKTNYEFGRLAAAYGEVNRQIRRIESEDEPTSDEVLEELKKRRLLLNRQRRWQSHVRFCFSFTICANSLRTRSS
jgi:uncharacterized protein YdcH (DUF465 family)